ncbi:MAG: TonB-dependent receptor [Bacteroidota bacterium]|nr:TonB-dependent receptor [Bacteroidota bacterium]
MKHIIQILIYILPLQLLAKDGIRGRVIDEDNKPIISATIYIPDLKTTELSDSLGFFNIQNLPSGNFLVEISATGFSQKIITINNTMKSLISLVLSHSAVELHGAVVTGVGSPTDERKSPIPMVRIDRRYIQQNQAANIIDLIAKVPGVSAVTTGPNVSKPYIRGLGYNRILTLFDGVRQDGQQWGDEHGIEVDQYLIDRIEIVKGPASLMYGSDALAGVVNLIPANPVARGLIRGNFTGNYQSNNQQWATSLGLAGNNKGIIWGFRMSEKQASNYYNKYDGKVFGTKYHERDLNANIGIAKKWGISSLNFSVYDNIQEIPDGSRDSATRKFTKKVSEEDTIRLIADARDLNSYDINVIHQHVQHYRLYSATNFFIGKSRLTVKLGLQQSHRREYSHPLYADLAGLNLILNTATYDIKYIFQPYKEYHITAGLNGMVQSNKNAATATDFVIPAYKSFDIGPFFYIKKSVKKFDFSVGARYDIRSFSNQALYTKTDATNGFDIQTPYNMNDSTISWQFENYKHIFSGMSSSIGATYNRSEKLCYKFNIARGYRSPNIAEISAKGVHPGTSFQQLGDANFKPEFSLQSDFGAFYYGKHFTISSEVFYNRLSYYIYNQKLLNIQGGDSIYNQNGNAYPVFKFHQTNAGLWGGEVSVDAHPHPYDWLHFENAISVVYAQNLGGNGAILNDSTKYLPLIPPLRTSHEIRAELNKKWLCFTQGFVKFDVRYNAPQNRVFLAYGTETFTAGYTLLDAGFGANVVNKKGHILFTFNIIGTNLTNMVYQSNMSRLKYMDNYPQNYTGRSGINNMGRNFSFKIVVPLI